MCHVFSCYVAKNHYRISVSPEPPVVFGKSYAPASKLNLMPPKNLFKNLLMVSSVPPC